MKYCKDCDRQLEPLEKCSCQDEEQPPKGIPIRLERRQDAPILNAQDVRVLVHEAVILYGFLYEERGVNNAQVINADYGAAGKLHKKLQELLKKVG